jgi:DeoR family suf operon transcriptional repressor
MILFLNLLSGYFGFGVPVKVPHHHPQPSSWTESSLMEQGGMAWKGIHRRYTKMMLPQDLVMQSHLRQSSPETTKESTKGSLLVYFQQHGQGSAHDLADHMGISPQAIRRHLKDLEQEGLLVSQAIAVGVGRPQLIYQLSQQGQEHFPRAYDEFAMGLLETLKDVVSPDQMGSILQKQWQRKAESYRAILGTGSVQQRVARLVDLRQAEGYMAEMHPYQDHPDQFVLIEHNCAISQIAQTFPSVCGHELQMFATALPDCFVQRVDWQVEGKHHCGYLIGSLPSA